MRFFVLLCVIFSVNIFAEGGTSQSATGYWNGPRVGTVSSSSRSYTAAMHNRFSGIQDKYNEGGEYFYSNYLNSFGQKEALNPEFEVIFCGPGDRNFTQTISWLQDNFESPGFMPPEDREFTVRHDSSSVGFSAEHFDTAVRVTLTNNTSPSARGRFCYDLNDVAQHVDYRTAGAEKEVYCDPASEPSLSFVDNISGFSCEIKLDAPLKVGETKFMRQLQSGSVKTIAQGFAGCYRNEVSGAAEFKLIENPESCSQKNRESCNYNCEWAHKMVCDSKLMPRWGGGRCGGMPTMLFKGDTIAVSSSDQLSYDVNSEQMYAGEALMQCGLVGGIATWIVTNESCQVK